MEVRKRMIELVTEAHNAVVDKVIENHSTFGMSYSEQIETEADYLVANGVTISPAVPGPDGDDHNIMELCFRNGERHMKDKIIARLMEHKTQVKGACHAHVVEIIKMVEGL